MEIAIRNLGPGDIDWLVDRHAELYARDEGFDATFPVLVREVLETYAKDHDPQTDRAFIAWRGAQRLGSVFCVRRDAETAQLRLFLLVPEARGLGLGKRLLSDCMAHARARGFARMVLWTHESHRAACALYRRFGWRLVRSEPKRSFGTDVVEQGWEVDL